MRLMFEGVPRAILYFVVFSVSLLVVHSLPAFMYGSIKSTEFDSVVLIDESQVPGIERIHELVNKQVMSLSEQAELESLSRQADEYLRTHARLILDDVRSTAVKERRPGRLSIIPSIIILISLYMFMRPRLIEHGYSIFAFVFLYYLGLLEAAELLIFLIAINGAYFFNIRASRSLDRPC